MKLIQTLKVQRLVFITDSMIQRKLAVVCKLEDKSFASTCMSSVNFFGYKDKIIFFVYSAFPVTC